MTTPKRGIRRRISLPCRLSCAIENARAERWLSGFKAHAWKAWSTLKCHCGFESLSLRQTSIMNNPGAWLAGPNWAVVILVVVAAVVALVFRTKAVVQAAGKKPPSTNQTTAGESDLYQVHWRWRFDRHNALEFLAAFCPRMSMLSNLSAPRRHRTGEDTRNSLPLRKVRPRDLRDRSPAGAINGCGGKSDSIRADASEYRPNSPAGQTLNPPTTWPWRLLSRSGPSHQDLGDGPQLAWGFSPNLKHL